MQRALVPLGFLAVAYARHTTPIPRAASFVSSLGISLGNKATGLGSGEGQQNFALRPRPGRGMAAMTSAGGTDLPYRYQWPRPAVTVDCLIYALDQGEPWILLIKRKNDPFKGAWALPGGFVDENEGLDSAARRELVEETGVTNCTMVQTGAYGDPGRDPRGHTITVAFMAWAPSKAACNVKAGDDAAEAEFYPVRRLPKMAFDHHKVISDSWARCRFEGSVGSTDSAVTVFDRATSQTMATYETTGLKTETLEALHPTEGEDA